MDFQTPDGQRLRIRPVRPDDKAALTEAFERSSARTRYLRFFAPLNQLTEAMLIALTEVDHVDRFAWVALTCEGDHEALIGVARYARVPEDPETADISMAVIDEYQGHGIGHLLLDALVLEAVSVGITRFVGDVLADNKAIRAVLDDSGARFRFGGQGTFSMGFDLTQRAEALRADPRYDRLQGLISETAPRCG